MTTILVTGATGQIGSELVPELRRRYGAENVFSARHKTNFSDDIIAGGPTTTLNITDYEALTTLLKDKRVKKYST